MNKFIRYYNQNKREIILIIIIIILFIIFLQLINHAVIEQRNNEIEISKKINNTDEKKSNPKIDLKPIISDSNRDNVKAEEHARVIEKFVKYCNNEEAEKAYNLISNECKNEMFPSIQYFIEIYYNQIFKQKKSYQIQNWSNGIYKVSYRQDPLSTGVSESDKYQDYITVIKENDKYKLNINYYIGKTDINKQIKTNHFEVSIISKNTYMDYEEYELKIKNNAKEDALLDNLKKTDTIYICDENDMRYVAYMHEMNMTQLSLKNDFTINLKIKFSNHYITKREMKKIVFQNVILTKSNKTEELFINL